MLISRHHLKIYASRWHLVLTIFLVVLPFASLFTFAQLAQVSTTELFASVAISCARIAVAFLIAAALGWGLGVLLFRGKAAEIGLPIFDVLQSFPTFAALPLAVYVWGPSNTTIVVFLVLTIIWPIFFSTVSSLKLLRRDWQEATQIYGLRGLTYLRRFVIPASLPGLITGSIVGLGEGWEALVATEIIVNAPHGLGGFFKMFEHNAFLTGMGIFCLLALIFALNKLVWLSLLEWSHRTLVDD